MLSTAQQKARIEQSMWQSALQMNGCSHSNNLLKLLQWNSMEGQKWQFVQNLFKTRYNSVGTVAEMTIIVTWEQVFFRNNNEVYRAKVNRQWYIQCSKINWSGCKAINCCIQFHHTCQLECIHGILILGASSLWPHCQTCQINSGVPVISCVHMLIC